MLIFEFHIISYVMKIILLIFLNHWKCKNHFNLWAIKKKQAWGFDLWTIVCWPLYYSGTPGRNWDPQVEVIRREFWAPVKEWSFFFFNLFYWSTVDLQCCVNFCCIAKWFSYTYMYVLFHIFLHYGLSQDIEYSSLCYTVEPCCLPILYIIACIC